MVNKKGLADHFVVSIFSSVGIKDATATLLPWVHNCTSLSSLWRIHSPSITKYNLFFNIISYGALKSIMSIYTVWLYYHIRKDIWKKLWTAVTCGNLLFSDLFLAQSRFYMPYYGDKYSTPYYRWKYLFPLIFGHHQPFCPIPCHCFTLPHLCYQLNHVNEFLPAYFKWFSRQHTHDINYVVSKLKNDVFNILPSASWLLC